MAERPILFSLPMVQATIAQLKTQTRRIVNLPKKAKWGTEYDGQVILDGGSTFGHDIEVDELKCPYGKVGDRLWVRETWRVSSLCDHIAPRDISPKILVCYLADDGLPAMLGRDRPSIFMPRWASRITLEITDIRVERLHEITEEDALAEGITKTNLGFSYCENSYYASAKEAYESLWKSINGVQSWLDNPWVWVITFKVAEIKQ